MKGIAGFTKWLVFTNLYIAIAAVCFQLATGVLWGMMDDWNWMLSAHTLFSTSLVYQFSRWNYHKQNHESAVKPDEIYNWLDTQSRETITSIIIASLGTFATLFFLEMDSIMLLAFMGLISMLYPLRLPNGASLRAIPMIKIFLIALIWSGISVWVPFVEHNVPLAESTPLFVLHVLFILFITLPFDMADFDVDKVVHVKTLPHLLGMKNSRLLMQAMGFVILPLYVFFFLKGEPGFSNLTWILFYIMTIFLSVFAGRLYAGYDKWKIMAVYDGSMILYFLITLASHG
ncbi:MAG: hypothetical protein GY751_07305 [Bacteroidetes bacterium]|nr:hypothetical protein [Bacteroidota bacterium]